MLAGWLNMTKMHVSLRIHVVKSQRSVLRWEVAIRVIFLSEIP